MILQCWLNIVRRRPFIRRSLPLQPRLMEARASTQGMASSVQPCPGCCSTVSHRQCKSNVYAGSTSVSAGNGVKCSALDAARQAAGQPGADGGGCRGTAALMGGALLRPARPARLACGWRPVLGLPGDCRASLAADLPCNADRRGPEGLQVIPHPYLLIHIGIGLSSCISGHVERALSWAAFAAAQAV